MSVPRRMWSPVLIVPPVGALAVVEPVVGLVAALGLFALWAGLKGGA